MTAARYLCLLIPVAALLAAARVERERAAAGVERERAAARAERDRVGCDRAGALLAFIAAATGLAALHETATAAGWWSYAEVDGAFRGFPVDLWLGWAVLWGPVPVLLRRFLPLPVVLGLLLWVDALAMPALHPLVELGPHWLAGEAIGLVVVALPAQLLGRWTGRPDRLIPRVLLQAGLFAVLLLWLIPTVAFTVGDGGWEPVLALSGTGWLLLGQAVLLLSVPALAAVREFAVRGAGTPFPWDPPRRLVTSGVYAYLANPMQVSAVLLLLLLAAVTRSATLAAGALSAAAFATGVAAPHEREDLLRRYGHHWQDYRREIRDWWPRTRPASMTPAARLWLDDDCGPCAGVRDRLLDGSPRWLTIEPASRFPGATLWRARYEAADGYTASGVAAVARALEHGGLLRAYAGWVLLLPGLDRFAQLVTDALIAPPHPAVGKNGGR